MASDTKHDASRDADRRLDPRHATRLEAVIDDLAHGTLVFTASGFSRTGAFLQRREPTVPLPGVGSVVQIVFRWPLETEIPPVRVTANVVRQTDDGVGVRFDLAA